MIRSWLYAAIVFYSCTPAYAALDDFRAALHLAPFLKNGVRDGAPFLVTTHTSSAVVCLIEKNGSSRLKSLFMLANWNITLEELARRGSPHQVGGSERWFDDEVKYKASLFNYATPRFVVVRNPYSRLLSAYLHRYQSNGPSVDNFDFPTVKTFEEFVRANFEFWNQHDRLPTEDPHFTPQVHHCWMDKGYSYDFHLKIEFTACWLKDILKLLNVVNIASSPWEATQAMINTRPTPCFFTQPNMDCSSYWNPTYNPPCVCETSQAEDTAHVTGAASQVQAYYTPEIASMVYQMYQGDFSVFHYPATYSSLCYPD